MKRFMDTDLWKKQWFMELTPAEKIAWQYILSDCDCVGVWSPNFRLAEFIIGMQLDWDKFMKKCNRNIEQLPNGKWFVIDFVHFQYGELNDNCRPHQKYIKVLKSHGLFERVSKGYGKGIQTLKEEEKEQDKEKDQDQEKNIPIWEQIKTHWNKHCEGQTICKPFRMLALRGNYQSDVLRTIDQFGPDKITESITRYIMKRNDSSYKLFPLLDDFESWMRNGMAHYHIDDPLDKFHIDADGKPTPPKREIKHRVCPVCQSNLIGTASRCLLCGLDWDKRNDPAEIEESRRFLEANK